MDIRAAAVIGGVRMWQIADELNIQASTLCMRMRKELPEDEKKKIFEIIDKLSE